jgi:predicted transporter
LFRIILGVFTAPLHSNGRGADHIENSLSIVEACLPSCCLAMGIHVTILSPILQYSGINLEFVGR